MVGETSPDTAKLTIAIVTGFGERCSLEGKMLVKDEAEILSRVGGVK